MAGPKKFFRRTDGGQGTKILSIAGIALIVIGLASLLVGSVNAMQLGLGIFVLLMVRWSKTNPMVRLHRHHLEMKAAIGAPLRLVLYRDIAEVIEESRAKTFLRPHEGKRIRLPIPALTESDAERLLTELRQRAQAAATAETGGRGRRPADSRPPRTNGLIVGGVAVDAISSVALVLQFEMPFLVPLCAGLVAISAVGMALALGGMPRLGAYLVMVGCLPFVPIGFIGFVGARNLLDELVRQRFEARRAELR